MAHMCEPDATPREGPAGVPAQPGSNGPTRTAGPLTASRVLELQRAAGNRALARLAGATRKKATSSAGPRLVAATLQRKGAMLESQTAQRCTPRTDGAPTAAKPKGDSTTASLAAPHQASWPVLTATGDPLAGLLQRSVAERATAGSAERARSWLPRLDAPASGSIALDAKDQEGPIGSTARDTEDEEGPIGNGSGSALSTRALSATRILARVVPGPCKDVEVRPHPALLLKGSRQPAVREAQRKLNLAKTGSIDAPLVPDCIFGPLTDAAVREFQTAQFGDPKEVDGKIGPKTWAKLDAGAAPGPTPPVPPPTPAPITITSATVKAAPSGAANTRKRVGVGEVVDFTASTAGTWAASNGTPTSGASSTTFRWTAPAVADTVTITLTSGTQTSTDTITVDAPKTISMRKVSSHTSLVGAGGACMLNEVTFGPTDVCLGAIQWLEVPGPATGVSGFFTKFSAATLHHNPNANFALVNDRNIMEPGPNNGPHDHCAWHSTPGPYKDGTFTWVVPNRYIVDGEPASSGRFFTDTHQVFTMNAAGTMTITKAGATT
jgi:peptidoglycan hydrolase-like protein with peptidoglycan-binding domain